MIADLEATSVLRRARNLRLQVSSANEVVVLRNGTAVPCGPRGLAILDAFHTPTPLGTALERLAPIGDQDWIDTTSVIVQLYRAGVLKRDGADDRRAGVPDGGFADPGVHAMMLNDRERTARFLTAVTEVVRPGDVVVDVGTGTGILAVASARSGARQVYAIEAGDIRRVARRVVLANGLAEVITVVDGWSTELTLPERADVLISEIIGEIPLQERVLEATLDARKRFLRPGARMIPSRLRIHGRAVSIPPMLLSTRSTSPARIRRWRSWYGIDLRPLAEAARGLSHVLYLDPASARRLRGLGPPAVLAEVDLGTFSRLQVEGSAELAADRPGRLGGVVVWFDLDLALGNRLTTDPLETNQASSWRNPVWILDEPMPLQTGDGFTLTYAYRVPGKRNGVSVTRREAGPGSRT